jgi:hypothetical protein
MAKGIYAHWELQDLKKLIRAEEVKREERDRAMGDPETRLLMESAVLSPSQQKKIDEIKLLLE